jgi:hypothetical protein
VVEHDDGVGEAVGLLEVLRRQHERRALAHELARESPQLVAAVRVETGRRLVQEDDRRRSDEAGREIEPAAHAAGERPYEPIRDVGEPEPLEQLVRTGARPGAGKVLEPADELEVRAGGQHAVDRRLLAQGPSPYRLPRPAARTPSFVRCMA